jgi:hypothetical protein
MLELPKTKLARALAEASAGPEKGCRLSAIGFQPESIYAIPLTDG